MFSLFIIVIAALAFTSTSTAQELKLGIVASEVVIQNYSKFQEAEKQLGREMQGWQAERKTWEADMERLQNSIMGTENKLQAGQNMMSEKKKLQMQSQIDSLRMDFNTRLQSQSAFEQERFTNRRAELLAEVFEEVNEVIVEMGETEGYDFIIDASNGTVVYAREPDDLNDQLLRRLQEK